MFCVIVCYVILRVSLSYRPPYNFLDFQSLFFVCFLKLSLKMVYPTIGIDAKRWGKMASVLKNAVFM